MEKVKDMYEAARKEPEKMHIYKDNSMCIIFYENKVIKLDPDVKISALLIKNNLTSPECEICSRLKHIFQLCCECYKCICESCFKKITVRKCPYCRCNY